MYRGCLLVLLCRRGVNQLQPVPYRSCCTSHSQRTDLEHTNGRVRTRFAPSPTGSLHVGGLRTALYNYLFARQHGGQFVLRIEDTDYKRLVPGSIGNIVHILRQMGIEPDEGADRGGEFGPYIQSQRLALYSSLVDQLLQSGAAYRCFCSVERLAMMKHQAVRQGRQPRYSNRCRELSEEKINYYLQRRVPYVVRLMVDETSSMFSDLVHGEGWFDSACQEGDHVLFKSNGRPTYHMASVVDDHLMGITHVLRGYEWYISTPKHIALYRALGWNPPMFAHLPLICNSDGTKLSKRQRDLSVQTLLDRGFLPEALLQYMCLSGGGFDGGEIGASRLLSMSELIERFNLSRVGRHTYQLQESNLHKINHLALRRYFCGFDCDSSVVDSLGSPQQLEQLAGEDREQCPSTRLYLRNILRKCIQATRTQSEEAEQRHHLEEECDGEDLAEPRVESTLHPDEAPLQAAMSSSLPPTSSQSCSDISDAYLDHVLAFYIGSSRVFALDSLTSVDCAYLWSPPQDAHSILHAASHVDSHQEGVSELMLSETVRYLITLPKEIAYAELKSKLLSHLKNISEGHRIKFSLFMTLLRAAISGVQRGPGVAEMIAVLGRTETMDRLEISLSYLKRSGSLKSSRADDSVSRNSA